MCDSLAATVTEKRLIQYLNILFISNDWIIRLTNRIHLKHTSHTAFKAVSDPIDISEPGTLFDNVAGITTTGIASSG